MKAMLKVFRYELIRNVQRRGYLFTTFGIPLIGFVILFGYQFITNLNESQSPTEQLQQLQFDFRGIQTAGYFDQSNLFSGIELNDVRAYASEAAARTALANGEIDALYVIQPDYAETG
jgi:ABC-2 type transport system permease protein